MIKARWVHYDQSQKRKKKVKSTDWAEVLEGGIEFRRSCGVMASGFRPTPFFYTHISTTTTSVCVHEGLHTEGEDNGKEEKPNNGSSGIFKKKILVRRGEEENNHLRMITMKTDTDLPGLKKGKKKKTYRNQQKRSQCGPGGR